MKRFLMMNMISVFTLLIVVHVANAREWRIPLGLTFISGSSEVYDQLEDNLEAEGYETETIEGLPVGVSIQPYYEFDSGFGIGAGFGPVILAFGDISFSDIPLNFNLRYAMTPDSKISPYIRAGIASHLVSGDYEKGSQAGFIGGLGLEFMRDRAVGFGIEVSYDSSTIELDDLTPANPNDTEEITPVGFMISIYAVF